VSRIDHLRNLTVSITRSVPTNQGRGKFKDIETVIAAAIRCRRSPIGSTEGGALIADRPEAIVTHAFYFSDDADILRNDILTIVGGTTQYEVLDVKEPSIAGVYKKAMAKEHQRAA